MKFFNLPGWMHKDEDIALAAVETLNPQSDIEELLYAAQRSPHEKVRLTALKLIPKQSAPDNVKVMFLIAQYDTSRSVRRKALNHIPIQTEPDNVKVMFDIAQNDTYWLIRTEALDHIPIQTEPDKVKILFDIAQNDEDSSVRYAALRHISEHTVPDNLKILFSIVENDENWNVRDTALDLISKHNIAPELMRSTLREIVLHDKSPDVRRAVVVNLPYYMPAGSEFYIEKILLTAVKDEDFRVREAAIKGIPRKYDGMSIQDVFERAKTMISVALNDKDSRMRKEALKLIPTQDDPEQVEALLSIALNDKDSWMRKEALKLIPTQDDPEQVETMLSIALNDESILVKNEALKRIPMQDAPEQVEALLSFARNKNVYYGVRKAAFLLIPKQIWLERMDMLISIALHDKESFLLDIAIEQIPDQAISDYVETLISIVQNNDIELYVRKTASLRIPKEILLERMDTLFSIDSAESIFLEKILHIIPVQSTLERAEVLFKFIQHASNYDKALIAINRISNQSILGKIALNTSGLPEKFTQKAISDLRCAAIRKLDSPNPLAMVLTNTEDPEIVETVRKQLDKLGSPPSIDVLQSLREAVKNMENPTWILSMLRQYDSDWHSCCTDEVIENLFRHNKKDNVETKDLILDLYQQGDYKLKPLELLNKLGLGIEPYDISPEGCLRRLLLDIRNIPIENISVCFDLVELLNQEELYTPNLVQLCAHSYMELTPLLPLPQARQCVLQLEKLEEYPYEAISDIFTHTSWKNKYLRIAIRKATYYAQYGEPDSVKLVKEIRAWKKTYIHRYYARSLCVWINRAPKEEQEEYILKLESLLEKHPESIVCMQSYAVSVVRWLGYSNGDKIGRFPLDEETLSFYASPTVDHKKLTDFFLAVKEEKQLISMFNSKYTGEKH